MIINIKDPICSCGHFRITHPASGYKLSSCSQCSCEGYREINFEKLLAASEGVADEEVIPCKNCIHGAHTHSKTIKSCFIPGCKCPGFEDGVVKPLTTQQIFEESYLVLKIAAAGDFQVRVKDGGFSLIISVPEASITPNVTWFVSKDESLVITKDIGLALHIPMGSSLERACNFSGIKGITGKLQVLHIKTVGEAVYERLYTKR